MSFRFASQIVVAEACEMWGVVVGVCAGLVLGVVIGLFVGHWAWPVELGR